MKRKVVKHGTSTFIISLPSKWVARHGIARGDELNVIEEEKSLIITAQESSRVMRIEINATGLLPRLVDRFLARSYQKGYDEILLIHNDLALLEVIKAKVHELLGYEIIEQDERKCLIKSIALHLDFEFENSLRRAFLIVKQMVEETHLFYQQGESASLKNIYQRDFDVNRLCYFCLRQINKEHYVGKERTHQTHVLYYLIESLEDLGDSFKKLAAYLTEVPMRKEVLDLLADLVKHYAQSYEYFYKPTREMANAAYTTYMEIMRKIEDLAEKKIAQKEFMALLYLKEAAAIIYHFTTMRLDFLKGAHVEINDR